MVSPEVNNIAPNDKRKHVFNLSVPGHSFLHHTSRVRLVRTGMRSCIFRGVSIDVSTDISIDYRSTYRSLCRSRVVLLSPECRSRVGRVSVKSLSDMLATLGRYSLSVDTRTIVGRYFADGSCTFTGESFFRGIP